MFRSVQIPQNSVVKRERECKAGFTLVELLVIMLILGILIAVIFPAFSNMKNRGYSVGCANNMRLLMAAVHRYVADHDGFMPWIAPSNGSLGELGYAPGNGTDGHDVNVVLGVEGYFDANPQILQCPGWRNWKNFGSPHGGGRMTLPINNANGGSLTSIRNTYSWRNLKPVNYNPPSPLWAMVPKIKLVTINEPSKEWYIADHAPGKNLQIKATTLSHGNGGFAAYVDGHVAWLTKDPKQWTTGEPWVNLPLENSGQFTRY
jgi:competence protein ComGC